MEQRSIDISNSFKLYYTSRAVYSFILFSWSRIISFSSPIFLLSFFLKLHLNKIHGVNVFFVFYATLLYWPVLIVVLLRGLPIKLEHPIDSRISGVKLYESVRLLSGL